MLSWIVRNRTVFCHWNCVLMPNWIAWNGTLYMYKNGFGINNLQWLMCHKTKPNYQFCNIYKATFRKEKINNNEERIYTLVPPNGTAQTLSLSLSLSLYIYIYIYIYIYVCIYYFMCVMCTLSHDVAISHVHLISHFLTFLFGDCSYHIKKIPPADNCAHHMKL